MNGFQLILSYFITAPISDYIFYTIMFIIAILSKYHYKKRELYVNLLAAIGMVGTFLGICIALQNFDSTNITNSVPELLKGMKTAFYTSLVGTGSSVILKIIYGTKGTKVEPIEQEFFANNKRLREQNDVLILLNREILNELKGQNIKLQSIKDLNGSSFSYANSYLKSISESNSLIKNNFVSEMETIKTLLRISNNSLDILDKSFRTFKEKMAQENNQAFTEAIGACVKNLNKEMMEQLGENFNKFNEGMMRLVTWQDKYIDIIKQTEDNQNKIVNTFTIIEEKLSLSSNSISSLAEKSDKIANICNCINDIIIKLNKSTEEADSSEEVLTNTIKDLTVLNNDLIEFKDLLGDVINNTSEANKVLNTTLLDSEKEVKNIKEDLTNYHNSIKEIHSTFLQILNTEFTESSKNIKELNNNLKKECINIVTNTATGMEITNKKFEEILNKHVENIQNELGKSLTSSLVSLGEELAALSEKFVDDYTPLTNKLREIVRIAEKVR